MYLDPTGHAAANVTVGNVTVGNAQVNNGVTTGNLRDIVSGLGGTVESTASSGIYTISMPNGATATVDTNNSVLKDMNGNVIGDFTIVNGSSQVSVRQMAQLAGVESTINFHKDSNGVHTVSVNSSIGNNSNNTGLLGLGNHQVVNSNSSNPYNAQSGVFNYAVRDAQVCLISMNYGIGGADGSLGPKTAEAIKKFQNKYALKYGLAPTGKLDEATLRALQLEAKDDIIARDEEWKSIIKQSNSILSKTAYELADPKYFLNYMIPSQNSIDPIFAGRLAKLAYDMQTTIDIKSGNRTFEEQNELYEAWLADPENNEYAAKPGESRHNYGVAIDLWRETGTKWKELRYLDYYVDSIGEQTTLLKYGLIKPMYYGWISDEDKWEPWHIQPAETRGVTGTDRLKPFLKYLK